MLPSIVWRSTLVIMRMRRRKRKRKNSLLKLRQDSSPFRRPTKIWRSQFPLKTNRTTRLWARIVLRNKLREMSRSPRMSWNLCRSERKALTSDASASKILRRSETKIQRKSWVKTCGQAAWCQASRRARSRLNRTTRPKHGAKPKPTSSLTNRTWAGSSSPAPNWVGL